MTLTEVYKFGKDNLESVYNYDISNEIVLLMQKCFNITKSDIIANPNKIVDENKFKEFSRFIKRRMSKEPLQYILGRWSFMGNDISVGPGVFIPRYDTEVLVEEAIKLINNDKEYKIVELCAGSGAISISLSKKKPDIEILAIEKSKKAFGYLSNNIELNECNIKAINTDIFDCDNLNIQNIDMLIANPPYIKTDDIDCLDEEVKMEPIEALDGGPDGLIYYRQISSIWRDKIKDGGYLIVEIGVNQSEDVKNIFKSNNFKEIYSVKDLSGIDRVIVAKKL